MLLFETYRVHDLNSSGLNRLNIPDMGGKYVRWDKNRDIEGLVFPSKSSWDLASCTCPKKDTCWILHTFNTTFI